MSMDALKYRLGVLVEGDWKTLAEEILRERKSTGKGKVRPGWLVIYERVITSHLRQTFEL